MMMGSVESKDAKLFRN